MSAFIKIDTKDSVVVALSEITQGTMIDAVEVINNIPFGHKIAIRNIIKGENIFKYGFPIGHAKSDIKKGDHVHSHNLGTNLAENKKYCYQPNLKPSSCLLENKIFQGYKRSNGDVGVRNELWIVPTVGCVNGQAKQIAALLEAETDTSHIDSIEVLSHQYGCSQLGDDHNNTRKALAAAIKHPNAGGVLVLGLGCENNQIKALQEQMGSWDETRVRFLVAQEVEDEVEVGLKIVKQLSELMKLDKRTEVPVAKLKIGLKCGGSDAFSGITANPLLGAFSDWLVAQGGSTVLTEVPEMFGAENTLMERATNEKVFHKIVSLINGFKDYFRQNNQVIYENPSPGNKDGGITTLEEKSLGNVQKGGTSAVVDVLAYGEQIKLPGLTLLWAPGNDLVSSSALAMAGCQIVLFTTGRGTPFGSFVPTLKIASNTQLFNKKSNWMDFNAGSLLEGETMQSLLKKFTNQVLTVANGEKLKHELSGSKEMTIFKMGVTL